jgi:predicted nucleic acid-binding protein
MPFIYLWEKHPRYFALSETLFRYLGSSQAQGVTSIITLIEVCVYPQQQGRLDLIRQYEQSLLHSRQVRTLPIDAALARRAIALRARHGLRVPDALQVAAALEAGATLFVTNDLRLRSLPEIDVLILQDFAPN